MLVARLLHELALKRTGKRKTSRINIRHVIAQHHEHDFADAGRELDLPARSIRGHLHAEIRCFARRKVRHRRAAALVVQIHHRQAHPVANAAAEQGITHIAGAGAVDDADVIRPRFERLSHAHRQNAIVFDRHAVGRRRAARPIQSRGPLIGGGPVGHDAG